MTLEQLKIRAQEIVEKAQSLSAKHTDQKSAPVNYACIFTQSNEEFEELSNLAAQQGKVVEETSTGLVFQIEPLETAAGLLHLLKIRRHDEKRTEEGDADFTVSDYLAFKQEYLSKPGFSLIARPNAEMIELLDPEYAVLVYYSHPTLMESLGLSK